MRRRSPRAWEAFCAARGSTGPGYQACLLTDGISFTRALAPRPHPAARPALLITGARPARQARAGRGPLHLTLFFSFHA